MRTVQIPKPVIPLITPAKIHSIAATTFQFHEQPTQFLGGHAWINFNLKYQSKRIRHATI
jgi:hypothetical protein